MDITVFTLLRVFVNSNKVFIEPVNIRYHIQFTIQIKKALKIKGSKIQIDTKTVFLTNFEQELGCREK